MNALRWMCAGIALAAVVGVGMAASAQTGDSSLSGTVQYKDGQLANSRIFLAREGKYRQYGVRFRGGRNVGYMIPGLLPGRYELLVVPPAGKPKRIWGVNVSAFEQKKLDVTVNRGTPEQEMYYEEEGVPIRDDMPREWQGGWLEGTILTEKAIPVEGTLNFYRGPTLNATIPVGERLAAYYETQAVPPGRWDLLFVPSRSSKLRRARVPNVEMAQDCRTILGTIRIPAGTLEDPIAELPLPDRKSTPVAESVRGAK